MSDVTYYTQEGLDKLKEELHRLKTVDRAAISKAIAEAKNLFLYFMIMSF